MPEEIRYRSGYKYQLADDYVLVIGIKPKRDIDTPFVKLTMDGTLRLAEGYA